MSILTIFKLVQLQQLFLLQMLLLLQHLLQIKRVTICLMLFELLQL